MAHIAQTKARRIDYSILIPVYNSEQSLPLVLEGVREVFSSLPFSYEFVLVDDGSSDNSWQVIEQQHSHGDICAIRFIRNEGHSMALKRAFEFCQGQWVITMDDDLQHPPAELPKLLDATQANPDTDVIMGAYGAKRAQLHKSIGARVYQAVLRSSFSLPTDLRITSFRAIHRRVVDEIVRRDLASPHAGFMILSATDRIINVDVEHHARQFGQSGMNLRKSVATLLDGIALNSTLPLKFIGIGGIVLSMLAMLLGSYYLLAWFTGNIGLSGFTTLVLLLTFFSGVILAAISIVGLYIMRLIQQATFSPHYSLRDYLPRED